MSWKVIWSIVKHELARHRVNPAIYLVLITISSLWLFVFFRQVFLLNEASLRLFFDFLPWFAVILVPALTMGMIAKEKSEQTLEILLTKPIREVELLLGKFISIFLLTLVLLLPTVPLALMFSFYGNFDWGILFASWFSASLLIISLISLGLFFSALFRDQIASLLVSVVVIFFWMMSGSELLTSRLPIVLNQVMSNLSPLTHFNNMLRGVVDIRDLWFFVSSSLLFLALSLFLLLKNKYGHNSVKLRSYQVALLLVIFLVILSNIAGDKLPGRLDLTQDRLYSLSSATQQVASNVPDLVTLTLFASTNIPPQLQPILRDTKDILKDYDRLGGDKIKVLVKNPSLDTEAQQLALESGVQEVQFNLISQEEFQVKSGFLGVTIGFADQIRAIPFIQRTEDLEYQITSMIADLTREDKPKIAIAAGHGEQSEFGDLGNLVTFLSSQYQVETINLLQDGDEPADNLTNDYRALLIASPTSEYEPALIAKIDQYVKSGGNVLIVAPGKIVNPQSLTTTSIEHNLNNWIESYGISIDENLVYDLKSNQVIRLGDSGLQYLVPYPFWVKAQTSDASPIVRQPLQILMTWPSEVVIDQAKLESSGFQMKPLVASSEYAGVHSGSESIMPNAELSEDDLSRRVLAVSLEPIEDNSAGRLIVIGSEDIFVNDIISTVEGNASLALASINWLTKDDLLSSLVLKRGVNRSLNLSSYFQPIVIMSLGYGVAIFVPTGFGIRVWWRRRKMKKSVYQSEV